MSNTIQPRRGLQALFALLLLLSAALVFWSIQYKSAHNVRPPWVELPMPLMMAVFGLQYWLAPPFEGMPQLWRRLIIAFFLGMSALMLIQIFV